MHGHYASAAAPTNPTFRSRESRSRREDGTIRNVRIAAGGAEGIRKTLQTQISATAVFQARKTDEDRAFIDLSPKALYLALGSDLRLFWPTEAITAP
jgi:hypothetical protein